MLCVKNVQQNLGENSLSTFNLNQVIRRIKIYYETYFCEIAEIWY